MTDRRLAHVLVAGVTLLLGSCGGSTSPTATPTPAPTAAPTPAAAPTPIPTAAELSCSLGKGTPDASCSRSGSLLLGVVDAALNEVVAADPGNYKENTTTGQVRVLDRDAFFEDVIAILLGQGMCAARIPQSDSIQVKDSNDHSEEYDLLTGSGVIRRGQASYQKTCTPAAFPLDVGDPVVRVYVGIFRFRCVNGVIAPPSYQNLLPLSCDAVITATPKDKDGNNVPSWLHSQDLEVWVRAGENDVVVLGEYPGQPFNRWVYPKGVGTFSICAAIDGAQTCMNARVFP